MELEVKEQIEPKPAAKPEVPPKPTIVPKISTPLASTRSLSSLRESMRRKIEPESAAALPKSSDDEEEEDRFCYTKDKIARKYGDLPGQPTLIKLVDIPPRGLGLSLAGKNEHQKKSVFVVDIKSTSPLPLQVGDELLEVGGKVFELMGFIFRSMAKSCSVCRIRLLR
jgi:hypothetical protein